MTRKRIATMVYGVFGTLVAAFVALSIVQVVAVCFGLAPTSTKPLPPACSDGIRGLLRALDRAVASPDFHASLAPEWDRKDDVYTTCSADPDAVETYAETLRLERLIEAHRGEKDGPLRKRLEARIGVESVRK